jgi:hypothetical protein
MRPPPTHIPVATGEIPALWYDFSVDPFDLAMVDGQREWTGAGLLLACWAWMETHEDVHTLPMKEALEQWLNQNHPSQLADTRRVLKLPPLHL